MGTHHHHGHSHSHNHSHAHAHSAGGNILVAFFLNAGFSILEFVGGYYTNSVAILSDAVHDLGDSMALLMAYILEKYSNKKPDQKFTYGYRRFSILSAFITSAILLVGSIFVIQKAIERIISPEPVHVQGVLGMAILGVIVNGFAAWKLSKGESGLNQRAVMLHLLEDVLGWVAVLIVGIVLLFKDWYILDPILSVLIALLILKNVYTNLMSIGRVVLQKWPDDLELVELKKEIMNFPEIADVHSVQAWSLDSTSHSLSLHVVVESSMMVKELDHLKKKIRHVLSHHNILHASVEFEGKDSACEGSELTPHEHHHDH
jgi:cobalt-zinc-cadmium efflux system protein